NEPLTPFVDLVRPLYEQHGVSTVLVMGGSGDYLDVADRVIMMASYHPEDATERALRLRSSEHRVVEADGFPAIRHRVCDPASLSAEHKGRRKLKTRGIDTLTYGESDIDLRAVEQIVDAGQVMGIGLALTHGVESGLIDGKRTVAEFLELLERDLADGADAIRHGFLGDYVVPRRFEVAAALARLRTLRVAELRDT